MQLLDWLRGTRPPDHQPDDPLADAVERANDAASEALTVINESRQRRGVPPLAWEDLVDPRVGPKQEAS